MKKSYEKNIDQLDKKHSTQAVHEFMSSVDSARSYFNNLLYVMGSELEYTKLTDDILEPIKEPTKLSNQLAKGFINEVKRQHLHLLQGDGYYRIETDANYILNKYGKYIKGDFKEYMNLAAQQQTEPIFDKKTAMYNLDRIRDYLVLIENSRDRWSEGDYAEDFTNMEISLYEAMFSVSHATFFDRKVENEGTDNETWTYTLKNDIRKQYEQLIEKNGDMPFAKELGDFMKVLKENNYELNDKVDSFLKDLFTKKFGDRLSKGITPNSGTTIDPNSSPEGNTATTTESSAETPAQ